MPTFFVSLITIYLKGFHTMSDLDEEVVNNILSIRKSELESYYRRQFLLSYYTNMTKEDIDNLMPFELNFMYDLLIKRKELESNK